MPRRMRCRNVEKLPEYQNFGPINREYSVMEEILLNIDELEAMRLKDIENLDQERCAERMGVSRQTFQIIIASARQKVTSALLNGNTLNITGGHYKLKNCIFKCNSCDDVYDVKYIEDRSKCTKCESENVTCISREGCVGCKKHSSM
ncbi:MAG TPA: hypothetical protein DEP72_03605 [Clostridiales bacterium]|nr:MAG: hypothetical protein A2Y18_00775 [Clostridiales bacterium GWD2_32_19]HCC07239.1 hypothetical protein [Clostridiales bacterium]